MLVNCVTVDALGICIHGIPQSSGTSWEAVQEDLACSSAQISGLLEICQKLQNLSRDLEVL